MLKEGIQLSILSLLCSLFSSCRQLDQCCFICRLDVLQHFHHCLDVRMSRLANLVNFTMPAFDVVSGSWSIIVIVIPRFNPLFCYVIGKSGNSWCIIVVVFKCMAPHIFYLINWDQQEYCCMPN